MGIYVGVYVDRVESRGVEIGLTHPTPMCNKTQPGGAVAIAEVRLPSVDRGAFEAGVLPFLQMHALEPMQAIPRVRVLS